MAAPTSSGDVPTEPPGDGYGRDIPRLRAKIERVLFGVSERSGVQLSAVRGIARGDNVKAQTTAPLCALGRYRRRQRRLLDPVPAGGRGLVKLIDFFFGCFLQLRRQVVHLFCCGRRPSSGGARVLTRYFFWLCSQKKRVTTPTQSVARCQSSPDHIRPRLRRWQSCFR